MNGPNSSSFHCLCVVQGWSASQPRPALDFKGHIPALPFNFLSFSLDILAQPEKLDDEWPESIFHHVGSQSVSYLLSVQCEVFKSSELR